MIEPSTGQTRFRAWYQIPDIKGRFPREGFGYGNGEAAPTFSQKRVRVLVIEVCLVDSTLTSAI